MGIMDSAIQADAAFSSDPDEFGESITYTRLDGTDTTIRAVIDRNPPARDSSYGVNTRVFDVWIAYDATNGLTSKPSRGDKITCKDDPADAATTDKALVSITAADVGGWQCEFA